MSVVNIHVCLGHLAVYGIYREQFVMGILGIIQTVPDFIGKLILVSPLVDSYEHAGKQVIVGHTFINIISPSIFDGHLEIITGEYIKLNSRHFSKIPYHSRYGFS